MCDDYDDGNWVNVLVECAAGGFSGRITNQLRTVEFRDFLAALKELLDGSAGVAEYSSMEDLLTIVVRGDENGDYVAKCILKDTIGTGNTLDFTLALDEAELNKTAEALRKVCEAFPVRGCR
jgi:hypothetical protein